jgi:hypothetical protein
LLLLLLTSVLLVNYSPVQNFLVRRAANLLSSKLKTKVVVKNVRIDFLNHILLQGLFIEDQNHDTLLYAGEARLRVTDWFIFKDKPVFHYIGLKDAYAHLYRPANSKVWNYDFIADAFSTGSKSSSPGKPFKFQLEKVWLENVRCHFDDAWVGEDMDVDVGTLAVDAKDLDFDKKVLDISQIAGKKVHVFIDEYTGGRPSSEKTPSIAFDTTPFNPDKWLVKVRSLELGSCVFRLEENHNIPTPHVFDENHLDIKNIDLYANGINIVGDTIKGEVTHLSAIDRCGLMIKKMRSTVSVSPIASVCTNLYLETNHSRVENYYAMRYKHFPNFEDYLDSVVMEGHLKDAIVDKRDLAFFAPTLHDFPDFSLHVSGNGKGTVTDLEGRNMNISDGNAALKGNITMKGLPDIYTTYISFTNGEILTTSSGILHYAPQLKNNPDVSVESITYAFFKGRYDGYIENFAVNGIFKTNLGTLTTNVKMSVPGFKAATSSYSGSIAADRLSIGTFFRAPLFGDISFKETISGRSFDPEMAQLDIDGQISEFTVNKYPYRNISTKGTLAKKQFNGAVLIDDPNLALSFEGGINYGEKNLRIIATAHLLGSNLKALNLTSDAVTASADFDLNCTGNNIDNFAGSAKLFNIDLKRNLHKVAVDSVYVSSLWYQDHRRLAVQSDALSGVISGRYQLSKLPFSVQYYLSRYIPNYIPAPTGTAPDQDFQFSITTNSVDSILAVTLPIIRGFDSATISGSLNTASQKLTLNTNVPHASIGDIHLNKVTVTGEGNLNTLALNTSVDNVTIGDSLINGSLSFTSTVGNDSVAFNLATTSEDISTSIAINGQVLARKDTLFLSLQPSQLFISRGIWDVAGGSKVVYSKNYLFVNALTLTSGIQKIHASSELKNNDPSLVISTENIDVAQLGSIAGISGYQPDGRINGIIKVEKLFSELLISTNLRATDVKLGKDTIGTVNIIGSYSGLKKLISIDPQTGIYRDNASIVASGNISFDSTVSQQLNGKIQFNNAPVVWGAPFVNEVMSNLYGTVNGSFSFTGSSDKPVIDGVLARRNAGLRLDYIGCNYTIPAATVHIDNTRIDFGKVQLFDRFNNFASLTGYFSHNLFSNIRMRLKIRSDKFEVMNLTASDNDIIYGNLVASMDSFQIRGPFDNIRFRIFNATPADKSHIFIPVTSSGSISSYNYVSFKSYGQSQAAATKKSSTKMQIEIGANMNELAEMTIVIDPATGDVINAKGEGHMQLDIPPNNDLRINGIYTINDGNYTFTFKQLFGFTRSFKINSGSTIQFNGPFGETGLDVNATYSTRAALYDLLTQSEKDALTNQGNEIRDAKTRIPVDVLLHMGGTLDNKKLSFDIILPQRNNVGSYAYTKLTRINQDDKQKVEQVGALLLANSFIPPDLAGGGGNKGTAAALSNINQVVSSVASTGLSSLITRLTGDKQLNINVKYQNYTYADQASLRSTGSIIASHNYFNDRFIIEAGTIVDWGKASTQPSTKYNWAGSFRAQYVFLKPRGLRLTGFSTSNYDLIQDRQIQRNGMGLAWRTSFDNFEDFFRPKKATLKLPEETEQKTPERGKDSIEKKTPEMAE